MRRSTKRPQVYFDSGFWLDNFHFLETSAISCLASITQGSQLLQQLLQKMEVIHEKKGATSRIRGLLI